MNSRRYSLLVASIGAAVCALLWSLVWAPGVVAGPDLAILTGARGDWHLLSGWMFVGSAAVMQNGVDTVMNVLGLMILGAVVAAVCVKSESDAPGTIRALAVGIFAVVSPFALPLLKDPVGVENSTTLALFTLVVARAAGVVRFPMAMLALLLCALVLQDFTFAPFALLVISAAAAGERAWRRAVPAVIAVGGCLVFSAALGIPHSTLHQSAVARSAVVATVVLFIALPLLFWLRATGATQRAGLTGPVSPVLWLSAGIMLFVSAFSPNGDPSSYLLASQIAVMLIALQAVRSNHSSAHVAGKSVAAVAVAMWVCFVLASFSPVSAASQQVGQLLAVLNSSGTSACIVATPKALATLSQDGALVRYYPAFSEAVLTSDVTACLGSPQAGRVAIIGEQRVTDLGSGGIALMRAARGVAGAHHILDRPFVLWPNRRTHMPGGRGAFVDNLDTPLGKVRDITIAAPYRVAFSCNRWQTGSKLSFAVSNPLGRTPRVGAVAVHLLVAGRKIAAVTIPPTRGGPAPLWRYYSATLPGSATCSQITFSVMAAGSNGIGTWASIAAPTIYLPKNEIATK